LALSRRIGGAKAVILKATKNGDLMNIKQLQESFDGVSRYFAIVAGWILLGLVLLVTLDVLTRKLFSMSVQGTDELGGYVMAILCAFGFSYALARNAHVRLHLILPKLPNKWRAYANLAAYAILAVYAYMLFWRSLDIVINSIRLKSQSITPLETPMWIPQSLWMLGLAFFSLHVTLYLLRIIFFIGKKQIPELISTFGLNKVEQGVTLDKKGIYPEG
jgi:TRAP-type C4-dicarboxylate transport system permease small subunit